MPKKTKRGRPLGSTKPNAVRNVVPIHIYCTEADKARYQAAAAIVGKSASQIGAEAFERLATEFGL